MKKLLICFVLLAALLLTVVACGNKNTPDPVTDEPTVATDPVTEPATTEKEPSGTRRPRPDSSTDAPTPEVTTPEPTTTTAPQDPNQLSNGGANTEGDWGEIIRP